MGIGGGKFDREKYCWRARGPESRWLAWGYWEGAEQAWGTAITESAWASTESVPVYAGAKNGSHARRSAVGLAKKKIIFEKIILEIFFG